MLLSLALALSLAVQSPCPPGQVIGVDQSRDYTITLCGGTVIGLRGGITVPEVSQKSGIGGQERKAYPGEGFPTTMKRDAHGNVVGDIFRFTREGLRALANWFTNEFRGTLKSGAEVEFDLGPVSLGEILEDLREMASHYSQ